MNLNEVAQTSGLLYRRLPACGLGASSRDPTLRATADYKSAIQQTRGLRYATLCPVHKDSWTIRSRTWASHLA